MRSQTLLRCSFACLFAACAAPAYPQNGQPVSHITADAIRSHVYFLASDDLGGRATGSTGYRAAAAYAEKQFRAAGLKPAEAGPSSSSFLQAVPISRRSPDRPPTVVLRTPAGQVTLAEGKDFKWFMGDIRTIEAREVPAVFVGYGISEPALGWDDFQGLDVTGKAVILMPGAPLRDGKPVLPEAVHGEYAPLSALAVKKVFPMLARRPAAIVLLADDEVAGAWDAIPSIGGESYLAYANPDTAALHIGPLLVVTREVGAQLFAGQARPAPDPARAGGEIVPFELRGVTLAARTSLRGEDVPTWNVVGVVEGTDPVLKREYVAVTAHLDSKPVSEGQVMNGADDDASGSAGVIEIARAIAAAPPKRSVVFALFAAEEDGAAGSRHFVSRCPVPLARIRADINLDMIGRTAPESATDRAHYALGSDRLEPAFTRLIRDVNARTVNWALKYEYRMGGSDDLSFRAAGIPAVNFYSGHHEDVNRPTDDAEKLDYGKAEQIARLAYEVTLETANRDSLWK